MTQTLSVLMLAPWFLGVVAGAREQAPSPEQLLVMAASHRVVLLVDQIAANIAFEKRH